MKKILDGLEMKDHIKILGAHGSKTLDTAMTCLLVDNNVLIDAGNILHSLDKGAASIDHILLTHAHLDHIIDIPFLIDIFFEVRKEPIQIYGLSGTIERLKEHLFNWEIWPDFSLIQLINSESPAIIFNELEVNVPFTINNTIYKPIKTNHTETSCGYVISRNKKAIFFTSDTHQCKNIWEEINNNDEITSVIVDVSFPTRLEKLGLESKHFTPNKLVEDVNNHLTRKNIKIFLNHLKPIFIKEIKNEFKNNYPDFLNGGRIVEDGDILYFEDANIRKSPSRNEIDKENIKRLINIGQELTNESNFNSLMEKILVTAKQLSNADGGTLYLVDKETKSLKFTVVQTDSLNIRMGGTTNEITWPNVKLYLEDGSKNYAQVAALSALTRKLINIKDVYTEKNFNFDGTKEFDKGTGYKTTSLLVVPMTNHEGDVIGVLQLLNKFNIYGEIVPFGEYDEKLIQSLSSQAAVSISNNRLIEELERLLMDFIKSTADAISEKSKYTGGHINRVPEVALMMANAINADTQGVYKNVFFNETDLHQLDIAAWMHDIGKITTPEYVVDKATKLETINDRINLVLAKFEIIKRDMELKYYQELSNTDDEEIKRKLTQDYEEELDKLNSDKEFVRFTNKGSEFMPDSSIERLEEIAKKSLIVDGEKVQLLNKDELYNLSIKKGTLTPEERKVINNHVSVSYSMLSKLSFPQKLSRVPLIAASHHKTIYTDENGRHGGYGHEDIMSEPMSIEDKILAIADVFEAISACDRPYKDANTINQTLKIMTFMAKDNELDYDLVKFFIDNKLYEEYARDYLKPEQMDEVTVSLAER